MKTRRRLHVRKRRTRKRGGMNGTSSSSSSSSGPAAAGAPQNSSELLIGSPGGDGPADKPEVNIGVGKKQPRGDEDLNEFERKGPPGKRGKQKEKRARAPPAGEPVGQSSSSSSSSSSSGTSAADEAPKSADELRHILITAAFRPDAEKATKSWLYPSKSTEMDVVRANDPKAYHKSSACGTDYKDLAARLTFALGGYNPGTPYYDVALELVNECLKMRTDVYNAHPKKDEPHALEIQLVTNLKTAIENCQAMGVKTVTVTYPTNRFRVDIPTRIRTVTNSDGSKTSIPFNGYEASRKELKEF
jgi:hypothetical protein